MTTVSKGIFPVKLAERNFSSGVAPVTVPKVLTVFLSLFLNVFNQPPQLHLFGQQKTIYDIWHILSSQVVSSDRMRKRFSSVILCQFPRKREASVYCWGSLRVRWYLAAQCDIINPATTFAMSHRHQPRHPVDRRSHKSGCLHGNSVPPDIPYQSPRCLIVALMMQCLMELFMVFIFPDVGAR